VEHLFRTGAPFPVAWPALLHNRLRLTFAHLSPKRIQRVIENMQEYDHFASALTLTVESDIFERRKWLLCERAHDDDWFFEKFDIRW